MHVPTHPDVQLYMPAGVVVVAAAAMVTALLSLQQRNDFPLYRVADRVGVKPELVEYILFFGSDDEEEGGRHVLFGSNRHILNARGSLDPTAAVNGE